MDSRVGINCESKGLGAQWGEQWKQIGTTVTEQQYKKKIITYFIYKNKIKPKY